MYISYWGSDAYYTRQSSLGVIDIRNITIRVRELDIWYPQIKKVIRIVEPTEHYQSPATWETRSIQNRS
jgi:hypothetical protein